MRNSLRLFAVPLFACSLLAIPGKAEITWTFSNTVNGNQGNVTGSFNLNPSTNTVDGFHL